MLIKFRLMLVSKKGRVTTPKVMITLYKTYNALIQVQSDFFMRLPCPIDGFIRIHVFGVAFRIKAL